MPENNMSLNLLKLAKSLMLIKTLLEFLVRGGIQDNFEINFLTSQRK